jgi:hypothetical protein
MYFVYKGNSCMGMFSDMGSQLLGGASGPLASLFGDKHSSAGLSFPSDVEGVGQRHFIKFTIVDIMGTALKTSEDKSSTEAETSAEGTLLGGLAGAAVGGGIGGGILGAVVGNAADKLGVSSAVGSLVSGAEDIIGGIGGALDSTIGGIAGSLETGIDSVVDTVLGPVVGSAEDLIGGALDVVQDLTAGALGVAGDLLSGDIPDIPDLPSLDAIGAKLNLDALRNLIPDLDKIDLPTPDFKDLQNAWDDIKEATTKTWGAISSLPGKLADAIKDEEPPEADAANPDAAPEEPSGTTGGTVQTVADIMLYIPFGITETYQANWSGGNLGLAGALGSDFGSENLKKMADGIQKGNAEGYAAAIAAGSAAAGKALESVKSQKVGFAAEFLGKGIGGILQNDAIQKKALKVLGGDSVGGAGGAGLSVNPHFELFFDGVNNRTFTFDFKMAPKNATEASNIASIVRMFKTHAAPGANKGASRYWTYPHVFQIEYWNQEQTHKIKDCALVNINVNYSGIGDNHTFYDGYPIQTDISLTFAEMSLLTREDFEQGF